LVKMPDRRSLSVSNTSKCPQPSQSSPARVGRRATPRVAAATAAHPHARANDHLIIAYAGRTQTVRTPTELTPYQAHAIRRPRSRGGRRRRRQDSLLDPIPRRSVRPVAHQIERVHHVRTEGGDSGGPDVGSRLL